MVIKGRLNKCNVYCKGMKEIEIICKIDTNYLIWQKSGNTPEHSHLWGMYETWLSHACHSVGKNLAIFLNAIYLYHIGIWSKWQDIICVEHHKTNLSYHTHIHLWVDGSLLCRADEGCWREDCTLKIRPWEHGSNSDLMPAPPEASLHLHCTNDNGCLNGLSILPPCDFLNQIQLHVWLF